MTTFLPATAVAIAGARYAKLFPTPVPASTIKCSPRVNAQFHSGGHLHLLRPHLQTAPNRAEPPARPRRKKSLTAIDHDTTVPNLVAM